MDYDQAVDFFKRHNVRIRPLERDNKAYYIMDQPYNKGMVWRVEQYNNGSGAVKAAEALSSTYVIEEVKRHEDLDLLALRLNLTRDNLERFISEFKLDDKPIDQIEDFVAKVREVGRWL